MVAPVPNPAPSSPVPAGPEVRPTLTADGQRPSPRRADEDVLRHRLRVMNLLLGALFLAIVALSVVRVVSPDVRGASFAWGALRAQFPCFLLFTANVIVLSAARRPRGWLVGVCQWVTVAAAGGYCAYFSLEKLYDNPEGSMVAFIRLHPAFAGMAYAFAWYGFLAAYGMFIPNGWKRCAAQTGVIGLGAVALVVGVGLFDPDYRPFLLGSFVYVMGVLLAFGYGTVVYNAYHVQRLKEDVKQLRQVGQYRLMEKLGEGGMGQVFRAEHRLLKRPCAVKLIRPELAASAPSLARFEREVRAMAGLSHWNAVEVYDFGVTDGGVFYYAMELLNGLSVRQLVTRYGPVPAGRVVAILRQVCAALGEAHARALVHRDVSPGNVFLAEKGGQFDVVKLLDFGLVRTAGGPGEQTLTQDGAGFGTPGFLAPEQAAEAGEVDGRADIYATAALGFYLLTGRPPFQGNSLAALAAQFRDPAPPVTNFCPSCPPPLAAAIARGLARDPADRFRNVDEFDAALAASPTDWAPAAAARWWAERPIVAPTAPSTVRPPLRTFTKTTLSE